MKKLIVVYLLLILLAMACAPVVEPTPIVVTATPMPTVAPTDQPAEYFVPVNDGHDLSGPVRFVITEDMLYQHRRLIIPEWASFVNNMRIYRDNGDDDCNLLPPYINAQDIETGKFLVEAEWVCGEWALAENNIRVEPGRYILKIRYGRINLRPSAGETWVHGDNTAFPRVYTSDNRAFEFEPQPLPQKDDGLEQIWVFETDKTLYIRVEWTWRFEWPATEGIYVIDDLPVLTAPPDFGNDVVVKF